MKKRLFIIIALGIFIGWAVWGWRTNNETFLKFSVWPIVRDIVAYVNKDMYLPGKVKIGKNVIEVEVVNSALGKFKGLSYRQSLDENKGMLFRFGSPSYYAFWMKGMQFPIDIIWIFNGQVVSIKKNVPIPVDRGLPQYIPDEPATDVLEVKAGYADRHNVKVGDKVDIEVPK